MPETNANRKTGGPAEAPPADKLAVAAQAAGNIAAAAAAEAAESEPKGLEQSFVWDYLTEGQREEARNIATVLCGMPLLQEGRTFLYGEQPVILDDFRVLKTGSGANLRHSVVYVGAKIDVARGDGGGIWSDQRSWDGVLLADPALFTVAIGDRQVDLRTMQTRDRLAPIRSESVHMEREVVLLTGEPPYGERTVPAIYFDKGVGLSSSYFTGIGREQNHCHIGFRPAVDLVG